jgi:uncharacterized membrane protein
MSRLPAAAIGTVALTMLGASCPALAEFKVCNQSLNLYNLAIGMGSATEFHTEGWWTLPANACISPIKGDLTSRYIYIYATNIYGDEALSGDWRMCVASKKFLITRPQGEAWNCWIRGYQEVKFKEIDTANAANWTVFIRESKE